jgi:hypothetical protein
MLAWVLLNALTLHVASTFFFHKINLAKLAAQEALLSPACAQLQLLQVGSRKAGRIHCIHLWCLLFRFTIFCFLISPSGKEFKAGSGG